MIAHLVPFLCVLQAANGVPAQDVQRDGVGAVWFAPATMGPTVLPVAVQVGLQLGPLAMVYATYATLPVANITASAWSVGARWFVGKAALAPFVTAEAGKLAQQQDDTGGREDRYAFASMGVGLEQVWAHHLSFSTDLQAGPGHREAGSYHEAAYVLWLQFRLALGVRF